MQCAMALRLCVSALLQMQKPALAGAYQPSHQSLKREGTIVSASTIVEPSVRLTVVIHTLHSHV